MKLEKPIIKSTVFENFAKLTNADENVRISGANLLIQQLEKSGTEKEVSYAMKRLIRGCGSSTSNSRTGFYTAFCGVLSANIENVPKTSEILEVMEKEFKEDKKSLDSMIGVALICGAIIRSEKMLGNSTDEDIQEIVKNLTNCSTKPSVAPLAYNFLAELTTKVGTHTVKSSVWPNVSTHLNITKDKITINPTYLLLLIEDHHPDVIEQKFYKKNWQSDKLLCSQNLDIFVNILWKVDKINLINHPMYVYFIKRLIDQKLVKDFWLNHVEPLLEKSKNTKLIDHITINCAISILKNLEEKPKEVLGLLTPNFLRLLVTQSSKIVKDEDIQEMYKEFYELLDQRLQSLKNDQQKLQALQLFKDFTIEKNSIKKFITNLVNSLEFEALCEALIHIKSVITGEQDEKERQYAATILQKILMTNKSVSNNTEWRIEQLIYFFNLAFLNSIDGVEVTKSGSASSISGNIKNLFFHSLEHKYPKVDDEKKVLIGIINHIHSFVSKKDAEKYFQKPIESKYCDIWNKMHEEVTTKPDKKDKKLKIVFHVLLMHMGLQLFSNSEIAENAISELLAVLDRAVKKKNEENEPEWIEVVVDLFLTLLSHESFVLRKVIQHVFPSLCAQINVSAFHQILSMLDVRSKENPLKAAGEDGDSDEEESDEDMEEMEVDENGLDEEIEESEEETSDVEMESEEEGAENDIQNSVRMAVQNALQENGDNDDDSDIDVDKISPEEGKRLNEALGNAFKMLMEHRNLKKKKKSKSVLMADKALLHFRMRILDLVEIYLKNSPQMEICLEILLFFFDLMPAASAHPELRARFEKIFAQLSQLKTFSLETVQNVTQKNLADTFTSVLEKISKEKTNIQQQNYFKQTCVFIIYSSHILQKLSNDEDDEVLKTIIEHMTQFMSQRNPTLQLTTFMKILSIQWPGNFKLAKMISDDGLKPEIRSLRRIQSLTMLREFFKNNFLFQQNQKKATKYFPKIFEQIKSYCILANEIPQPEFFELIHFTKAMKNFKDCTVKDDLIAAIQKFRKHLILKQNILNAYRDLCSSLKFEFVPNNEINPADVKNHETDTTIVKNGDKKRNKNAKGSKKEKKLKRIKELEEASKGLENVSFV